MQPVKLDGTNYFVHEKSQIGICFSAASCEVLWEFLMEAKTLLFIVWATPLLLRHQCLCLQRVELRWNTVFCLKIMKWYFERHFFPVAPVPKFWWRFCEYQGWENFLIVSLGEYQFFVDITVTNCLASENFVLPSDSNPSLATGLASLKVSVKPCRMMCL